MNNKDQIKNMTFASMMIAVFVVLHFIFPANNNGVQGFLSLIAPIPIAIYAYYSNIKHSIMIIGIGLALSLLFFDPILVVSFILPNIVFGLVMGTFLKNSNMTWLKTTTLVILSVGFNFIELYINYLITGIDLIAVNISSIDASIDILKTYFTYINKQILLDLNIVLLPLMFIVGGIFKTIVSCFSTQMIIERIFGKKAENHNIEYYATYSIYVEVIVLFLFTTTIVLWTLVLTNIINYFFVYSVLLDIMILAVIAYYGLIHKKITAKFRDKKLKYIIISLVYMSLFFIIAPVVALKTIINRKVKK